MLYSKEIRIPANTSKNDPLGVILDVVEGTVKRVWVRWYWGSGNLCGCRLVRGGSQVWPTSLTEWFLSSPYPLTFEEAYPVTDEPLEINIEAYNLDDTYSHTVWVGVLVLRQTLSNRMTQFMEYLGGGG